MTVGKAVLDRHVSTLGEAAVFQPLVQGRESVALCIPCLTAEDADHRHPSLLRPRRERPGDDRAAEKCDELAPPHGQSLYGSASILSKFER
jgi:hypothetical protein